LDDFYTNRVLTPEKLAIGLRQARIGDDRCGGTTGFQDAPHNWLEVFDAYREVPNRYDNPDPDGIVQVLITPRSKRFSARSNASTGAGSRAAGRGVCGQPVCRARRGCSKVIDPEQFERERERAGLLFDRFTAISNTMPRLSGAGGPATETVGQSDSQIHQFADDHELAGFIAAVEQCLSRQLQLCAGRV